MFSCLCVETTFKGRLDLLNIDIVGRYLGERFSAFTSIVSGRSTCKHLSFVWTNCYATVEEIK
jgi:hypothetical protein